MGTTCSSCNYCANIEQIVQEEDVLTTEDDWDKDPSESFQNFPNIHQNIYNVQNSSKLFKKNENGQILAFMAELLRCKGFEPNYIFVERFGYLSTHQFSLYKNRIAYFYQGLPNFVLDTQDIRKVNFYRRVGKYYFQIVTQRLIESCDSQKRVDISSQSTVNISRFHPTSPCIGKSVKKDEKPAYFQKHVFALSTRKQAVSWKTAFKKLSNIKVKFKI